MFQHYKYDLEGKERGILLSQTWGQEKNRPECQRPVPVASGPYLVEERGNKEVEIWDFAIWEETKIRKIKVGHYLSPEDGDIKEGVQDNTRDEQEDQGLLHSEQHQGTYRTDREIGLLEEAVWRWNHQAQTLPHGEDWLWVEEEWKDQTGNLIAEI